MLLLNSLDISYLENYLREIKDLTPSRLKEVANLYLKDTDLSEIVVGK
ncbi:MAG: hypothetical protein IPK10_01820 [Bacteroidetes bacterium]|nr:hypothetical protein [Bacteroidota bacterium]